MSVLNEMVQLTAERLNAHGLYVKQTPLFCELVFHTESHELHTWQFPPTHEGIEHTRRAMGREAGSGGSSFNWHHAALLMPILRYLRDRLDVHPTGFDSFAAG